MRLNNHKYRIQTLWWFVVWAPIAFFAFMGSYLSVHYGPWCALAINMFLYTWGLWTGLQETVFGIAQMINLPMHFLAFDEITYWAPIGATILCIAGCQAIFILARLQQQQQNTKSSSTANLSSYHYPFPTLPISYTYLYIWLMTAIGMLLWARAFFVLRWIIQASAISSGCAALVLFLQLCVFLLAGDVNSVPFMRDNHMTVVYCMMRLTSITSVLVSKLVLSESIRAACCYTFFCDSFHVRPTEQRLFHTER